MEGERSPGGVLRGALWACLLLALPPVSAGGVNEKFMENVRLSTTAILCHRYFFYLQEERNPYVNNISAPLKESLGKIDIILLSVQGMA